MRRSALASIAAFVFLPLAAGAAESGLLAHWVQLGPGGIAQARIVVEGKACPDMSIDGRSVAMTPRAAAGPAFALACWVAMPSGAKSASVMGAVLPLPVAEPKRILVLGDTGCRIKGMAVQACNDPAKWPFPVVAASAATLKPDLVIHVGDYLYRENACPPGDAGCKDTPFGDNWPTWAADFFDPAAPLLAAAPIVAVRGNHEDCQRAGPGWIRLLGPKAFDPAAPCADHLAPYNIPLGAMRLVVMDDAGAPDTSVDAAMVPTYRGELAALADDSGVPEWLVMHRPIWAAISGPLGLPIGGNATLIAAAGDAGIPKQVQLMLAGHIHAFEALNYDSKAPPQILAGHGGDNLDATPADLKGTIFQGHSGVGVKDGLSVGGFGFLLMAKTEAGWRIDLYDASGAAERSCSFAAGRVDCPKPSGEAH